MPISGDMLNLREVCELVGVSQSTLYKMVKRHEFPPSVKITPRRARWPLEKVEAWMAGEPWGEDVEDLPKEEPGPERDCLKCGRRFQPPARYRFTCNSCFGANTRAEMGGSFDPYIGGVSVGL